MKGNYFEVKIKREKVTESGMTIIATESYLLDAFSFTEAEARIIEELAPYISGQLIIKGIKRAMFEEVFTSYEDADDKFYKFKLQYSIYDERRDVYKLETHYMLVQAASVRLALERIEDEMRHTMVDYEVKQVAETEILSVFRYKDDDVNPYASIDAETPAVRKFLTSLPEGMKTVITVAGRRVVVDKTGRDTKVIPQPDATPTQQQQEDVP